MVVGHPAVVHVGVELAVGQCLSQSPRPLARRHRASSCLLHSWHGLDLELGPKG